MLTKRKPVQEDDSTHRLALDVLLWIVAEEERLHPFLGTTGLSPDDLRAGLEDPAVLAGALDYVMGEETLLLTCARDLTVRPERIAAAWQRLSQPRFEDP